MDYITLQELGSKTAKWWFQNENDIIEKFNDWKHNNLAKKWLLKMNYQLNEIEFVKAVKISGSYKADIQVQIQVCIKLKSEIDCQNISIKLVSNSSGFNQIDKRWLAKYKEPWEFNDEIFEILQYFVGEKLPKISNPRDKRRMFFDEFSKAEQEKILDFFEKNKFLIVSDLLKWRGKFSAEWFLVILKNNSENDLWALEPINYVMNFFIGKVRFSPQWSLYIWKITMQRKWWDNGRDSAKMLQFKINPALLIK